MDPITIHFPIIPAAEETAADLKDDLIEEILSLVPAKSVLYWKSVCKPWQRMLDNPIFARIHFSRATLCPLLVSGGKPACRPCRIMHLVEGRSVSDLDSRTCDSKLISRFDIRTRAAREQSKFKNFFFGLNTNATSCEGLLCWTAYDQNRGHCIIISNPITREYVSLKDKYYAFVGMGFRRETKKFELLKMATELDGDDDDDDEEDPLWWPEVRGVGDSSWRRVGGGTSRVVQISQVVYVDGSIYWSYEGDVVIYCFNFDRAMFQAVAMPETSPSMNCIPSKVGSLGVLDGALCASQVCPGDGHVELFVLVDVASSALQWKKRYDVETKTTHLEHMGVLWPRGQYKVIKRLSRGEILMHDWRGKFIVYDPVTKEESHVCLLEDSRLARNDGLDDDLQVVSHVPCLVGLKEALNVDGLQVQSANLSWESAASESAAAYLILGHEFQDPSLLLPHHNKLNGHPAKQPQLHLASYIEAQVLNSQMFSAPD